MLQAIRDKAQGWIAWAIVIFISIPFALWGIQEYLGTDADPVVAEVEGHKITEQDLEESTRRYRDNLRARLGAAYKAELFSEQLLRRQVLDQMIDERVLQAKVADWGMRASSQMVVDAIAAEQAFKKDGRFDHALYTTVLRNSGMSEAMYEASVRQGLALDQLQNGVAGSSFSTKAEVAAYNRLLAQKRTVAYAVIDTDRFLAQSTPDDAAIQAYYDDNRALYKVDERVKLDYLILDAAALSESIQATDAQLEEYFAQHRDEFFAAEERSLRHILIPLEGDETAARAKAQDLHAQITAGADFATLAKTQSADPGSADNGGDLGWVPRGMMVGPFEEAAFALSKGAISEPVKSTFGYHIIQLQDVRGGGDATLDQVRDKVEAAYRRSQIERDFFERAERLAELAYENPDNLRVAADELGLSIQHSDWLSRSGGAGDLASPKVSAAAFSEDVLQGNNSEMLELGPEKLMVLRVTEHQEARPRALDEVREQVVVAVRNQQAVSAAKAAGEKALERLKAGEDLATVAQANGWRLTAATAIDRDQADVPVAVRDLAFQLARPEGGAPSVAGTELSSGEYALLALSKVEDGDMAALDSTGSQMLGDRIAGMSGRVQLNAMMKTLREQADIKIMLSDKPAEQ